MPQDFLLIRQFSQVLAVLVFCDICMLFCTTWIARGSLCFGYSVATGLLVNLMGTALSMKFKLFWDIFFRSFHFRFIWFSLFLKRTFYSYFCWWRFWVLKWNLLDLGLNCPIHNLTPILACWVTTFYERVRGNIFMSSIIRLTNRLILLDTQLFNLSFSIIRYCRLFSTLLHLNRLDYSGLQNIHVTFNFANFRKFKILNTQVSLLLSQCWFTTIYIRFLWNFFPTTLNSLMNLVESW